MLYNGHCIFLWADVCNRTFVQESKFFDNTNILLSNPTKKSNAVYSCPLCATLKTTRPSENEQNDERENANASAKSKELHAHAQIQRFAAHLLLPKPHNRHFTKLKELRKNVIYKKRFLFS